MRSASTILRTLLILGVSGGSVLPLRVQACTGLQYTAQGEVYLAKNHDFMMGEGLLIVNPRGHKKGVRDSTVPLEWTSRFGSVTYNQFGQEHPIGGMNEAGLVVEVLWLDQAQFPAEDVRPDIGTLQWVQYQLDTAETVADVISSDEKLRILDPHGRVHYFLVDSTGDAAVIEWIGGRRVVHRGENLPVRAVANDPYALSVQCLADAIDEPEARRRNAVSHDRFSKVAEALTCLHGVDGTSFGFAALEKVRHPEFTQFQTVYSASAKMLTLKRRGHAAPIVADLGQLDFSAGDARYIDLSTSGAPRWQPMTFAVNRALVFASFRKTPFLSHLPDEALEAIARTPLAYH